MKRIIFLILLVLNVSGLVSADIHSDKVKALVDQYNAQALKEMGTAVLPILVKLYESSDEQERGNVATMFYQLGWKSAEAKRALMKDAHTQNQLLRLQVFVSNRVDRYPGAPHFCAPLFLLPNFLSRGLKLADQSKFLTQGVFLFF